MSVALVVRLPCQGPCGKQVAPTDLLPLGDHVQVCRDCHEFHLKALAILSGTLERQAPPKGCQECETPFARLKAESPDGSPTMWLVQVDGVYAILCRRCREKIMRLRKWMFKGTPHGAKHQLH